MSRYTGCDVSVIIVLWISLLLFFEKVKAFLSLVISLILFCVRSSGLVQHIIPHFMDKEMGGTWFVLSCELMAKLDLDFSFIWNFTNTFIREKTLSFWNLEDLKTPNHYAFQIIRQLRIVDICWVLMCGGLCVPGASRTSPHLFPMSVYKVGHVIFPGFTDDELGFGEMCDKAGQASKLGWFLKCVLLTSVGVGGDGEQTAESLTPVAAACLALMGCALYRGFIFHWSRRVEKILDYSWAISIP